MNRLLVASLIAISATAAHAQEPRSACGPHDAIVKGLAEKFKESRVFIGLINEKTMMEKFASPAGTWTDVVTNEQGLSCITAFGEAFEFDTSAFDKAKKGGRES